MQTTRLHRALLAAILTAVLVAGVTPARAEDDTAALAEDDTAAAADDDTGALTDDDHQALADDSHQALADDSPPALADGCTPAHAPKETTPAFAKLGRGLSNVVLGLPGEIVLRVVNTAHSEEGIQSLGSYVGGVFSGLIMGVAWGAVRVESGLIDVLTFPFPFNNNRPLFEPDYAM